MNSRLLWIRNANGMRVKVSVLCYYSGIRKEKATADNERVESLFIRWNIDELIKQ